MPKSAAQLAIVGRTRRTHSHIRSHVVESAKGEG